MLERSGPSREPTPAADLFRAARENLPMLRPMKIQIAEECPELDVDPSLVLEILVNLMENADRASPPGAEIELHAASHPADSTLTRVEILDRGEGISDSSDTTRRGLGLQIARAFAEAHNLKLGAVAQPLRVALTGRTTSPGIFNVLAVLGRDESLARLGDQASA